MKLPFGKTKVSRPENMSDSQNMHGKVAASRPSPDKKPGFWKSLDWKLMLALLFPVTLETLDYTIVATAQSRIASVFNALPLESYIGTSYLLASTVFLPLFASIADIYGRHFGLQVSLLFFLIGSVVSTGAMNMPMILAGRGIAGIGAAGLLTIVRTVISDTASLDENNIQQSMLFLLYFVGFSVGPVAGGYLVAANFRWVFAINLPCTAAAILLCFFLLRNRSHVHNPGDEEFQTATQIPTRRTVAVVVHSWVLKLAMIDWVGTFLFISGGILVLLALNWGPGDNWKSVRVILDLVLGALLILLCLLWEIILERRAPSPSPDGAGEFRYTHTGYIGVFHPRPMLPVEMFTSYDLCVVQYDSFVSGIVMFVMFYFVAVFATMVTGLPPAQAGIQLLYFAPGLGGGSLISMRMIKLLRQPVYPIVLGSIIMTVGVGLIQMAMQRNIQGEVNGFMAMAGVGVGMSAGPLVVHARFTKPDHVAIMNALLLFFRAFGGTVGLAQCFTVLNAKVNTYITSQLRFIAESLPPADLAALESLLENGLTSVTSLNELPSTVQSVVRDAFRDGVRWSFVSLLPWLGVGCVLSVFLSKIEDPDERGKGTGGSNEQSEPEIVEMVPHAARDVEAGAEISPK